jgi:hypothetical protein
MPRLAVLIGVSLAVLLGSGGVAHAGYLGASADSLGCAASSTSPDQPTSDHIFWSSLRQHYAFVGIQPIGQSTSAPGAAGTCAGSAGYSGSFGSQSAVVSSVEVAHSGLVERLIMASIRFPAHFNSTDLFRPPRLS